MRLHFGPFRLDSADERLWRGDTVCPLTPKAFAVLRYLVEHPGVLISKDTLKEALWAVPYVSDAALGTCIREVRQALGDSSKAPQFVETVRGRGFRFLAPVHDALAPSLAVATTFRAPARTELACVGRDAILAQLEAAWQAACQGEYQMVFLTGEAGMGKTTLVETFLSHLPAAPAVGLGHGQCIEHYGAGEAYLPLLAALGQLCRAADGPQCLALLRQHAPSWLLQMPALLAPPDYAALRQHSPDTTSARMLRELAEAMDVLTAVHPVVLILEDLHWCDAATLDWLAYVARRRAPARLLLLGTYRPEEARGRVPSVHTVVQELTRQHRSVTLSLPAWTEADVTQYLRLQGDGPGGAAALPLGLARALQQRSQGNPMFLSTLVIDALQQGILWHNPRGWEVAGGMEALLSGVPDSLQQLIDQRLTQLPAADQEILEVASVAGKAFTAAAVATILPHAAYHLDRQCAALARQGQFIAEQGDSLWPDGTVTTCYVFRHDLYQATLYARVSAGQRLQWHRQIGRRLVDAYGKRAPELAVELAEHFMRGQALNEALPYLEDAGQQAMQRHAYAAAQTHLTTALTILRTLPATVPHRQRALRLHLALGETLLMRHGPTAPEVRHAYSQAQALCQDSTPTSQHFAALAGLWRVALNRPHLPTAQALAEQCVTLAHPQDEPALFQEAQMMQGATALYRGALPQALVCLEQAAYAAMDAVAHPQQGTVPAVVCRARMAWVVWLLGLPERACQIVQDALALAQELAHPFSVAFALHYATVVHLACGALALARQHAHTTLLLCDDYGFTFFGAMATFLQEVTTALLEPGSFSSPHLQRRLDAIQATGSALWRPYGIALCAMTSQTPAEVSSALHLLAEACTLAERTEERYYGAEVARLRGECWLRQQPPAPQEALQSFQEALTMARAQQAQSLALRAALSLSRLWQQQGKPAQAYALLHDVYSGFTEGFATADLRTASTFLEDLAQGR